MEPSPDAEARWGSLQRLAVRFAALYLPLYVLSGLGTVSLAPLGQAAARLAGASLPPAEATGSGDRAVDWYAMAALLALSAMGAVLWTALARRDPAPRGTHRALRVALRYGLATTLLMYGFGKATQFGEPPLAAYSRPFGEMLPMELLWSFMGYSAPYALFTGAVEIAGGFLLLFRRTTTLGALVYAGAMANVLALNLCYDVPVKLLTFHLLLGALVLLLPDARRLLDVLVLNRPTVPVELGPPVRRPGLRKAALAVKWLLVGLLLWSFGSMSAEGWRTVHARPSPLTGVWRVARQEGAGPRIEWALVDANRGAGVVVLNLADRDRWGARLDPRGATLTLVKARPGAPRRWACREEGTDRLTLTGVPDGPASRIELVRDQERFPLMRHGFHWVQERPYTP